MGAEPNVRPPGAVSPTGETSLTVEILLLRTPPGECNCSLHSRHGVHFEWVNISRVNSFVSGPKFTYFLWNAGGSVVDNAVFILSTAFFVPELFAIKV